jgi:hypothetical protein
MYDYYSLGGLNLSKNSYVSVIIDLITILTLNHYYKPRQLTPTIRLA